MIGFLVIEMVGAVVGVASIVASGVLADQIGRRNVLGVSAVLIGAFSGFAPQLLDAGGLGETVYMILGFILLGLAFGQSSGAVNSSFPMAYRYTGAALTSDLAWLLGAGFAPLVALVLSTHFGLWSVGALPALGRDLHARGPQHQQGVGEQDFGRPGLNGRPSRFLDHAVTLISRSSSGVTVGSWRGVSSSRKPTPINRSPSVAVFSVRQSEDPLPASASTSRSLSAGLQRRRRSARVINSTRPVAIPSLRPPQRAWLRSGGQSTRASNVGQCGGSGTAYTFFINWSRSQNWSVA